MLPLLVLLGTIAGAWYLLIVHPQRNQQSKHGALVSQLQVGSHVLTVGGIYGRVVGLSGPGSVDVELSGPGSPATRIATDAIAQIVPGGPELTAPIANTNAHTQVTPMQQPPHEPQHITQPPAATGFVPPPLPAFGQHAPFVQTTLRAQVIDVTAPLPPAPILKPWADVAPRQPVATTPSYAAMPQHGGANAPVSPGFQLAHQQAIAQSAPMAAPQYATSPSYAQQQPQQFAQPQQYAPQPVMQPQYAPQPMQVAAPVHAPVVAAPMAQPVHEQQLPQVEGTRQRSRAPQGMGSNLRLDDPSLQDSMVRARGERAELADDYRRMVAPLVDTSQEDPAANAYASAQHGAPSMQAGQAPPAPGRLFAHQAAAPQGAMSASGMPRPHVTPPSADVDPALFARRTPMAHQVAHQTMFPDQAAVGAPSDMAHVAVGASA